MIEGNEVYVKEIFILSREDHLYGIGNIVLTPLFLLYYRSLVVSMTTSFFLYIFTNSLFSDSLKWCARLTFIQTLFLFPEFLMLRFNYAEMNVLIID